MRRKVVFASILLILLLALIGSPVYAQGGGDKFVFGEDFVLRSGEVLSGNLAVLGGSATLEQGSTVNGDVAVAGGQLTVAGTIAGSAAVFGGDAVLQDTAVIEGDFATFGGAVARAPGAVIQGETFSGMRPRVSPVQPPEIPSLPEVPIPALPRARPFLGLGQVISWQFVTLGSALMMILLGIVALLVAPKQMSRIASAAAARPALSFGAGILTVIVGILAGTLLLIACCLGVFVWLALAIASVVGWIAVGLWFGQRLLALLKVRNSSALIEVALGLFLITVIGRLPLCIGALFSLIVGSIGLGAVVLTRFGQQPAPSGAAGPARKPTQSLEALDAEVLAPLALTSTGSALAPEAPQSEPLSSPDRPAAEPGTAAPLEPSELESEPLLEAPDAERQLPDADVVPAEAPPSVPEDAAAAPGVDRQEPPEPEQTQTPV